MWKLPSPSVVCAQNSPMILTIGFTAWAAEANRFTADQPWVVSAVTVMVTDLRAISASPALMSGIAGAATGTVTVPPVAAAPVAAAVPAGPGGSRQGYVQGPADQHLRMVERTIDLGEDGRFVVGVAGDAAEIDEELRGFDEALLVTFGVLAVVLVFLVLAAKAPAPVWKVARSPTLKPASAARSSTIGTEGSRPPGP